MSATNEQSRRRYHVLIIEDDALHIVVTACLFIKAGFRITTAETGEEALASLPKDDFGYDLILLDLSMPDMDSLDIARSMLAMLPIGQKIPVIALVEEEEVQTVQGYLEYGLVSYITKPVNIEKAQEAVARFDPIMSCAFIREDKNEEPSQASSRGAP